MNSLALQLALNLSSSYRVQLILQRNILPMPNRFFPLTHWHMINESNKTKRVRFYLKIKFKSEINSDILYHLCQHLLYLHIRHLLYSKV